MNVERTIEFMLKNQARTDARFNAKFDRADGRFRKAEERMNRAEARLDRLERVVRLNNRVVARLASYGVSLRGDIRRLTKAQAETDRMLKAFLRSMAHGNGRG